MHGSLTENQTCLGSMGRSQQDSRSIGVQCTSRAHPISWAPGWHGCPWTSQQPSEVVMAMMPIFTAQNSEAWRIRAYHPRCSGGRTRIWTEGTQLQNPQSKLLCDIDSILINNFNSDEKYFFTLITAKKPSPNPVLDMTQTKALWWEMNQRVRNLVKGTEKINISIRKFQILWLPNLCTWP